MVKGNKGKIDNLGRIVIPKSIRKAFVALDLGLGAMLIFISTLLIK